MRERLTIGEAAKLAGVTPKAIRHYHKLGLLEEPERSEGGYRLYDARDLMRLARIRRLRFFGLSLKQIETVVGEPGVEDEQPLRPVLEALHGEISQEIRRLEERRARIEALLAGDDPDTPERPRALKLAEQHLAEHLLDVDPGLLEQDRKLWAALDAFEWPGGYRETVEAVVRHYAEHPDEYRNLVSLAEPLVALDDLPAGSSGIEDLAREFVRRVREGFSLPTGLLEGSPMSAPLEAVFRDITFANLSPAQQRFWELVEENLSEPDAGGSER